MSLNGAPKIIPGKRTWVALLLWLAAGGVVSVTAILLYTIGADARWTVIGIGLIVAAGAMVAGGLLGFIFGVPRVLAADGGTNRRQTTIVGNTNLEQISDWLTKILVGIGLTQFAAIAGGADRMIDTIAPAFGTGPAATIFAGGLGVFAVAFGFVTGWLYSRLLLGGAMAAADSRSAVRALTHAAEDAESRGDDAEARALRDAVDILNNPDPPRP